MKVVKKWFWLMIIITIGIVLFYSYNVYLARCTIPYSDFFRWILDYSKKLIDGNGINVFFDNDGSQHYQPLIYMISMGTLHLAGYDFSILTVGGIFVKIVVCLLVVLLYKHNIETTKLNFSVTTVFILLSMLNFNQWEIITEPFALASAIRIGMFFLSFWQVAYLFSTLEQRKDKLNYIYTIGVGVLSDLVIITMCGGYFVAYSFALIFTVVIGVITNRNHKREHFVFASMYILFIVIGIICYINLGQASGPDQFDITFNSLIILLQGFMIFWGTSILPTSLVNIAGMQGLYLIIGILLVILMLWILIYCIGANARNFSLKYLFVICLITYSNALGFTISLARVPANGIMVMASSRYTIDSSFGLIACAWGISIMAMEALYIKEKRANVAVYIVILLLLCIILAATNYQESRRSKYIRQFYDNIENELQNINSCSDEFLMNISGTDAETTRRSLKYMEQQGISIYKH